MMAKTHGLTEFAHTLEETLKTMDGIDADKVLAEADIYARKGKALLPLRPVFVANDSVQSTDWPMVNLRAKEAERAALIFKRKEPEIADNDDMFFDAKEYHTSNKQIANILTSAATAPVTEGSTAKAAAASIDNAKWVDEDDINIDDDLMNEASEIEGQQ